jgi:hypothetical protein
MAEKDADGQGDEDDDQRRTKNQLEGGRGLGGNDRQGRLLMEKRQAQIPFDGIFGKTKVLGHKRIVEAQLVPQRLPFSRRDPLAHHVPDWIADFVFDGKSHQADDQHDEERLGDASDDKGKHNRTFQ